MAESRSLTKDQFINNIILKTGEGETAQTTELPIVVDASRIIKSSTEQGIETFSDEEWSKIAELPNKFASKEDFGLVKIGNGINIEEGTISTEENKTLKATVGDIVYEYNGEEEKDLGKLSPENHSSSSDKFGKATNKEYGHVKIANNLQTLADDIAISTSGLKSIILDLVYPIGSYYITEREENPSNTFGGGWEQIIDKFLYGAGGALAIGAEGGNHFISLTSNQIPSHNHSFSFKKDLSIDHKHNVTNEGHTHGKGNLTVSKPIMNAISMIAKPDWNEYYQIRFTSNILAKNKDSDFVAAKTGSNAKIRTACYDKVFTSSLSEAPTKTHSVYLGALSSSAAEASSGANIVDFTKMVDAIENTAYSYVMDHEHSLSGTTASAASKGATGSPLTNDTAAKAFKTISLDISGTTGSTGTGALIDIMPPFRAVNIWKRIS